MGEMTDALGVVRVEISVNENALRQICFVMDYKHNPPCRMKGCGFMDKVSKAWRLIDASRR